MKLKRLWKVEFFVFIFANICILYDLRLFAAGAHSPGYLCLSLTSRRLFEGGEVEKGNF